jgi:hypothetical protein
MPVWVNALKADTDSDTDPRPRIPLVSVRENLWLKKHAGTAEPFSVARPEAVVLAINK